MASSQAVLYKGSESEAEARTNHLQGPEWSFVMDLFFRSCLRLRQCSFHLIVSDEVISGINVLLLTLSA